MSPEQFAATAKARDEAFARFEALCLKRPFSSAAVDFGDWLLGEEPELHAAVSEMEQAGDGSLPGDVVALVLAARAVAFGGLFEHHLADPEALAAIQRLDRASEAFADRVPWAGQPLSGQRPS